MDTPRLTLRRLAFLVAAAYAPALLANPAARIEFSTSEPVIVGADGRERPARKGEAVLTGDRVLTRSGRAQLAFTDGAFVSLQPNTDFGVTEYNFKGSNDGNEKSVLSLLKGALRTVTGLIGRSKRDAYQMHTPTATIGIRGTGGRIEVNERGTLVAGTSGTWFISTLGGSVDVPAGSAGFAGADSSKPPEVTSKFPNTPQIRLPEPELVIPEQVNASGTSSILSILEPTPVVPSSMADGSGYLTIPSYDVFGPTFPAGSTATFNSGITLSSFNDSTFTQSQGTTQILESGNDGIIGWGRWTNGSANLFGSPYPLSANQGLHYIVGVPTATMPVTGGGTYIQIGATNPTGVSGLLPPGSLLSANLMVNFLSGQLDYSVSTSVGGYTYAAAKTGLAITGSSFIDATPTFTGSACVGGTDCSGKVAFLFAGSAAERAGLSYFIQSVPTNEKVIGVVVFKQP